LPPSSLTSLVAKLDKASAARAEEGNFAVSHILALALREVEPLPVPAKAAKADKVTKQKKEVVRLMHQSKALGRKV
jgi:hypothetical protein